MKKLTILVLAIVLLGCDLSDVLDGTGGTGNDDSDTNSSQTTNSGIIAPDFFHDTWYRLEAEKSSGGQENIFMIQFDDGGCKALDNWQWVDYLLDVNGGSARSESNATLIDIATLGSKDGIDLRLISDYGSTAIGARSYICIRKTDDPDLIEVDMYRFLGQALEEVCEEIRLGERDSDYKKTYFVRAKEARISGNLHNVLAESEQSRALGLTHLGNINVILKDMESGREVARTETDDAGNFEVEELEVGSEYIVEPVIEDVEIAVQVEPSVDVEDVGTVNLTDKGYNFKMRAQLGKTFMFADEYTPVTVFIDNVGTETNTATTYKITMPVGTEVSDGVQLEAILGSIEPGSSKSISLSVKADGRTGEVFTDYTIPIELKDLSGDVWKDSVSIRVYQQKAIVAVGTPYWDIAGTYRSEHGQRERLRTRRSRDNSDLGIVHPPSINRYTEFEIPVGVYTDIALVGGDVDHEERYSIAINAQPSSDSDLEGFTGVANFEPNNDHASAATLQDGQVIQAYLHEFDLDMYRVDLR